jgi:hypothetical protein
MEPPQDIFLLIFILIRGHTESLLYMLYVTMILCSMSTIWYVFMGPGLKITILCFFVIRNCFCCFK